MVQSELGKQLDSFSDLVSFGLAPACLVYVFLGELQSPALPLQIGYLKLFVLFLPVFSVLRLAKFTLDDQQENEFIGLPTPANALFFASAIASLYKMESLYKIAALDEEGLMHYQDEYYLRRVSGERLKDVSKYFCWGEKDFELLKKTYPESSDKLVVAGNTRLSFFKSLSYSVL